MSSITHFYHLAAQSYIQGPAIPPWTPYFPTAQYHAALRELRAARRSRTATPDGTPPDDLWSAVIKQYVKALRIRRLCLEAGALFAGRMPMTSSSSPAARRTVSRTATTSSRSATPSETLIEEVGRFVISEYIPLALALGDAVSRLRQQPGQRCRRPGLRRRCAATSSPGARFPGIDAAGTLALKGGWKLKAAAAIGDLLVDRDNLVAAKDAVEANLKEFITLLSLREHLRLRDRRTSAYPGDVTRTEPERDDAEQVLVAEGPALERQSDGSRPARAHGRQRHVPGRRQTNLVDPVRWAALRGIRGPVHSAAAALDTHRRPRRSGSQVSPARSASAPSSPLWQSRHHSASRAASPRWTVCAPARSSRSGWSRILVGGYDKGSDSDHITFSGGWVDELKALWPCSGPPPTFYRDTDAASRHRAGLRPHRGPAWRARPLRHRFGRQDHRLPVRRSDHVERLAEGRHRHGRTMTTPAPRSAAR